MTTESPPAGGSTETSERVAMRTLNERRRRVVRSVVAVVAVMIAMVILSIMNRDAASIRSCEERMEYARDVLQSRLDKGQPDPTEMPVSGDASEVAIRLRNHVHFNAFYGEQKASATHVGVCCCRRPHSRLFRDGIRHVVVFDAERDRYELLRLTEADFARQAESLRLHVELGE